MTSLTASAALEAVEANGQIRPAIVSGSADVSKFIVGPNGNVYVLFTSRVNLEDTTLPGTCLLAEVDPSTGVPICVDDTLARISWPQLHGGQSPAIQLDGAGALYYAGSTSNGHTVLRKYFSGTRTDLINDNISLYDFLVQDDGGVVVTGTTTATGANWLRYISPTGSLQGLAAVRSNFLSRFPDGNVYAGLWGMNEWGVKRFLTSTHQLESKFWISSSMNFPVPPMYNDARTSCPPDLWTPRYAFCGWNGTSIQDSFTTSDDKVFVIAGGRGQGGMLMQYYPVVAVGTTAIQSVYVAESAGSNLVLSGLNSNAANVTNFYDTSTGLEAPIFSAASEIEIYHLTYVPETKKMLFDGLRFSDNKYVLGEIDLT